MEGRPCRFPVEGARVCAVAVDHPDLADRIVAKLFERLPPPHVLMGFGQLALLAVPTRMLRVL